MVGSYGANGYKEGKRMNETFVGTFGGWVGGYDY